MKIDESYFSGAQTDDEVKIDNTEERFKPPLEYEFWMYRQDYDLSPEANPIYFKLKTVLEARIENSKSITRRSDFIIYTSDDNSWYDVLEFYVELKENSIYCLLDSYRIVCMSIMQVFGVSEADDKYPYASFVYDRDRVFLSAWGNVRMQNMVPLVMTETMTARRAFNKGKQINEHIMDKHLEYHYELLVEKLNSSI